MASDTINFRKGEVPPHPPPSGPKREQWSGWAAWDQYCKVRQQERRLNAIRQFIIPSIDYFYSLDEESLRTIGESIFPSISKPLKCTETWGFIELLNLDFPEPPDLGDCPCDTVDAYLQDVYRIVLKIALPRSLDERIRRGTRQTTLGRYLQPYKSLEVSASRSLIRLLEVLPSVDESEPILTRLFTADLDSDDCPLYEALSYAWGEASQADEGQRYHIHVNGYKRAVTPNLHSALSSLRHSHHPKTLWIDSMCINQADDDERGQQVERMARIYVEAHRVLVYLGPPTPSSVNFFSILQHLLGNGDDHARDERLQNHELDHDHERDHEHSRMEDPGFWKICHDAGPDLIEGLIELCSRTWWTRVWVLQEYTLNKRDPVFYCGRLEIANSVLSKNFRRLYNWVEHRKRHDTPFKSCPHPACSMTITRDSGAIGIQGRDLGKEGDEQQITEEGGNLKLTSQNDAGYYLFPKQGSFEREWSAWGQRVWRINHVLNWRHHCSTVSLPIFSSMGMQAQCTIPHDAVYGLRELMDPLFRSLFPPDYTIPLSTLFTRLAVYVLVADMNTNIFWYFPHRLRDRLLEGGAQFETREEGVVPSWVPDFTRPRVLRAAEPLPSHTTLDSEDWELSPHIFDRVLFMSGLLLDEIVEAFPLPSHDPFLLLQQLWYVERLYMDPNYLHRDDEQQSKTFYEMLIALNGYTTYPSIAWATDGAGGPAINISIVELLGDVARLQPLVAESLQTYLDKIPSIVDVIMGKEQRDDEESVGQSYENEEGSDRKDAPGFAQAVSTLNIVTSDSGGIPSMDRKGYILQIGKRLFELVDFLATAPTWTDFVGICAFDYHNLRAQVLHRLCIVSAQRIADLIGHMPDHEYLRERLGPRRRTSECGTTHAPAVYGRYLEAIENCVCHPLETHFREGFVIDLAAKLHKAMATMVGLEGDTVFKAADGQAASQEAERDSAERPQHIACTIPVTWLSDASSEGWQAEERLAYNGDLSSLGFPHFEDGYPFGILRRWRQPSRLIKYDVHICLQCVVAALAGRELFVTETGLVGLTGVGVAGVQGGDDIFMLRGMSHLLIARLEPSSDPGAARKSRREMSTRGMRREIVGTSTVKGIDPKDGAVEGATIPSWFNPITDAQGRYRFY